MRKRERFIHGLPYVTKTFLFTASATKAACLSLAFFCFVFLNTSSPEHSLLHTPPIPNIKYEDFFCPFSNSKSSIRFHHILVKQLHQENDSACGINYACSWPETRGCEVGEGRIARHTQIKSPWISQMDPISSSYCLKSSCT